MEISREEYLELKRRIEELEKKQVASRAGMSKGWAYAVNELPIEKVHIKNWKNPHAEAEYRGSGSLDAWMIFVKLAKQIHARTPKYRWKYDRCLRDWFWIGNDGIEAPKNYRDLTDEQKLISLEMLNELIPIYNKYFKELHPGIWIETKEGEEILIEVCEE